MTTNRVDYVMLVSNYSAINDIVTNVTNNSNSSTPNEDFDHKWSFEFSVIIATILSISAFFTIMGNVMVLMVIIRHRGMRTRTNLFLVNLAVADLLVGLFVVPFTITTLIRNEWIFGTGFMCKLNGWMNSFCLITSFHTLMYISIHKYFSIVRPLSNPLRLKYIIAMMAAAWMWAAILSTVNITGLTVEYKPGTSQCGPKYPHDVPTFLIHGVIQLTVIVVPAAILVFCYVRMFMAIKKHSQRLRTNATVEEDFILSQQKKVAVTLFIVLATFVMMALPYHIYATYTTIEKDKQHFSSYLNPLAYMFLYLSSMCNPIIYAFRSPAFREGYKEILCQTPDYVISDDSELAGRTRRLSSLISTFRRISTHSASHRNSLIDPDTRALTPEPVSPLDGGDKRGRMKPTKQRSLFDLLRSTRQSTAQSVIHRNGDVIIMKGGKIVSVRRGGEGREGSPFTDRLQKLRETSNLEDKGLSAGLAGPGHVMFGLVCEGVAEQEEDNNPEEEEDVFTSAEDGCSTSGKTETDKRKRKAEPVCMDGGDTVDISESGVNDSHARDNKAKFSKNNWCQKTVCDDEDQESDPLNVLDQSNTDSSDVRLQSKSPANSIKFSTYSAEEASYSNKTTKDLSNTKVAENVKSSVKHGRDIPYLQTSRSASFDASSAESPASPVGVVINVGEDDEILSVMPLTPHTRDFLAKSDVNISETSPNRSSHPHMDLALLASKAQPFSFSSENVIKNPPATRNRLPSVEFLDPPVHLFRTQSNVSMSSSQRRPRPRRAQSKSPENKASSRSPNLRSLTPSRRKESHENITEM